MFINLKELEQAFIDKIDIKKEILRKLKVRSDRVEKLKRNCYRRIHSRGNSKFLEEVIKRHDKELHDISVSSYHIRCDIWSYSATVCRLREKRRGKSKQWLEQILIKSVLQS